MSDTELLGLRLEVVRPVRETSGDTSGGGPRRAQTVTDSVAKVTLVGTVYGETGTAIVPLRPDSRKWEPTAEAPAFVLVKRPGMGDYLRPAAGRETDAGHTGHGGNFAASSDSRFSALLEEGFYGAVPVHDYFVFNS